jgi:peptide/nickel transport system substrate-binding protein
MITMRMVRITAGVSAAALALAGCSSEPGEDEIVEGATFTLARSADPGNLDPQASAGTDLFQFSQFAYDSLLSIDAEGVIDSQLASEWTVEGSTVRLTLNEGITCSDGTPFTAVDAAANVAWVADPANESPWLGVLIPPGATASADSDTALTIELTDPAPFVLNGLAILPMVCGNAIEDRSMLAAETHGTGPFVLTDAAQGDRYTYELRDDYTWGPGGATTAAEGMPAEIVVRVIGNETTAANLLLSGELNAATITGPDTDRLEAADLFSADTPVIVGQMWFNQSVERPMTDPTVRLALSQALDLDQLMRVITSDKGEAATTFAVTDPVACPGNSIAEFLPEHDPDAAAALLDDAGWEMGPEGVRSKDGVPLAVTLVQDAGSGDTGSAAGQLAVQTWTDLGVQVTREAKEESVLLETIFGTGDWDVAWVPLNVSSPEQLVGFMSGPSALDGGSNFAQIDNPDYQAAVEKANALTGPDSCENWLTAESALVRDTDVIPFANQLVKTFGSGATFEHLGSVAPTSIRMLAE